MTIHLFLTFLGQELITMLGLGGGTSEAPQIYGYFLVASWHSPKVTVCDLAARLTALGFDGDAQHAAVLAARLVGPSKDIQRVRGSLSIAVGCRRCDRGIGTKISAQKLLKVLTSNAKGTNVDQGGPKA